MSHKRGRADKYERSINKLGAPHCMSCLFSPDLRRHLAAPIILALTLRAASLQSQTVSLIHLKISKLHWIIFINFHNASNIEKELA